MNDDPRSGLTRLVEEIEKSAYNRGADETREHFSGTIREAIRLLSDLLEVGAEPQETTPAAPAESLPVRASSTQPRAGSDQMKVLDVVRTSPGLRATEIVGHLQGDLGEASVRTALHRLKNRGAIIQKESAWFVIDGEPP
jgi:hypothetical protein